MYSASLLLLFASIYAAAFFLFIARSPKLVLLLIFASAPFQEDLSVGGPVRFSFAEINLLLGCVALLIQVFTRGKRISVGPILIPFLLYLAVCLIGSIGTLRDTTTVVALAQMPLYFICAVAVFASLAKSEDDYWPALYGLIIVAAFLTAGVIVLRSNYILGLHKNGLGSSEAAALVVAVELWFASRRSKVRIALLAAIAVIALGLILSLSRGAWLGTSAGLAVLLMMRRRFITLLRVAAALVPLVAMSWVLLPREAQEYATDIGADAYNTRTRINTIATSWDEFKQSPVLGIGVAFRKNMDATNLIIITMAESGVLGLVTLTAVFVAFGRMIWKTQQWVRPPDPLYSLVAIGAGLMACKAAHGLVDHFWARGELMLACAGMGMATAVYLTLRKERHEAVLNALLKKQAMRERLAAGRNPPLIPASLAPPGSGAGSVGVEGQV